MTDRAAPTVRLGRTLGSPALFAIVWVSLASTLYFALGIVADRAQGLTPLVFLFAGCFFALAIMTYVEGASLHQERAGSTVFARHAFNEFWSFVAGWAILLDFLILLALTSFSAANYLGTYWSELGRDELELAVAVAIIAYVAWRNLRGAGRPRYGLVVIADLALQLLVVVVGICMFAGDLDVLTDSIDLGSSPEVDDLIFALTLGTIVVTCLESASGLSGEVRIGAAGLRRLISSTVGSVVVIYVGIAVLAATAVPATRGGSELREDEAPVVGVVEAFDPGWATDGLRYAVAGIAAAMLLLAANAAMLGLSRLGYSLATNRQIPSAVGRLHPKWGTPFVIIGLAAVLAIALVLPKDLEFLVGIYAVGSLISVLLAHLAICRLRFTEPDRPRPYRVPLGLPLRGGTLPVPAALGALLSMLALGAVLSSHGGARYLGLAWMAFGVALYVIYRRSTGKPLGRRVSVPEAALRSEPLSAEYSSILVPVFGGPLDDDIIQTAGRLAAAENADADEDTGPVIEALFVFEIPLALPLDARLPEEQLTAARAVLARAKAVGEEYEGVEVATATVRARRAGEAIVAEARRRGVEAIVLAAEEPSRIRGGARFGGSGAPLDNFVGEATKYVVRKAHCRVILTAPPADDHR